MEENRLSQEEKRELRKRRRRRNQAIAYLTVLFFLVLVAGGIMLGVKELGKKSEKQILEKQDMLEDIFSEEEELEMPESTEQAEKEQKPEDIAEEKIEELIGAMSLEDKVAGLFIVTPEAITGVSVAIQAGDGTKTALEENPVGGLIYFKQNIRSAEQLKEMLDNTTLYARYPLFLAIDEEGGSVSRLAEAGLADTVSSAGEIGALADTDSAYQTGKKIGGYMSEYGFNLNFAPVADLANVENSVMEERAYGANAAEAAPLMTAMLQGMQEQQVTGCLKHFPGQGSTVQDTHDGQAVSDRTAEEFYAEEFAMFQAGIDAGANMIMVGHMAAPALTGDNTPCSLSDTVVTEILRRQMNYDGVIITDALNMSAISEYYSSKQACILALRAGCDMLLMPEDYEQAYTGVLQAVREGTISEERIDDSLRRIYRIKYADMAE